MGWENKIISAIDERKTSGGVDNVFMPATLVSTNPPVINICGCNVSKQLHISSSVKFKKDETLNNLFSDFMTALDGLKEIEEVPELVENLKGPLQELFDGIMKYHQKDSAKAGDTVMVRQDGNDLHVLTRQGG